MVHGKLLAQRRQIYLVVGVAIIFKEKNASTFHKERGLFCLKVSLLGIPVVIFLVLGGRWFCQNQNLRFHLIARCFAVFTIEILHGKLVVGVNHLVGGLSIICGVIIKVARPSTLHCPAAVSFDVGKDQGS
jgi:hypothetical protein